MAGLTFKARKTGAAATCSLTTHNGGWHSRFDADVKNQMMRTVKTITMGEFEDFSNNADDLSVGSWQKE